MSSSKIDITKHQLLAIWVADCAKHILYIFENTTTDNRPRKAIEATLAWARGEMKMTEVRKFALAAHEAARDANTEESIAAARSAGHAAATAHAPGHAIHAANYAIKAVKDKDAERVWQLKILPVSCKPIIDLQLENIKNRSIKKKQS